MIDKRKNISLRQEFDNVYTDLKDILSCYEEKYYYEVINNYLKVNKLFLTKDSIRGRLFWKLLVFAFNKPTKV